MRNSCSHEQEQVVTSVQVVTRSASRKLLLKFSDLSSPPPPNATHYPQGQEEEDSQDDDDDDDDGNSNDEHHVDGHGRPSRALVRKPPSLTWKVLVSPRKWVRDLLFSTPKHHRHIYPEEQSHQHQHQHQQWTAAADDDDDDNDNDSDEGHDDDGDEHGHGDIRADLDYSPILTSFRHDGISRPPKLPNCSQRRSSKAQRRILNVADKVLQKLKNSGPKYVTNDRQRGSYEPVTPHNA